MHVLNASSVAILLILIPMRVDTARPPKNKFTCEYQSCIKRGSPSIGADGGLFCARHQPSSHLETRKPRCLFPAGCHKQASFGNITDRAPSLCSNHRAPHHVPLFPRGRCSYPGGCGKFGVFGSMGDSMIRFCADHKDQGHSNVIKPWCR